MIIIPLQFFNSNIIYFSLKAPIKVQILRLLMANYSCHFSKHKSVLVSFFLVMTNNSSVLFWLKHSIVLTKLAHQSASFQNCRSHIKINLIPHDFVETKSQFFFNITSLLSVIRHNCSVIFHLKLDMLGQKEPIKVKMFRLLTDCMKINKNPYVILQTTS